MWDAPEAPTDLHLLMGSGLNLISSIGDHFFSSLMLIRIIDSESEFQGDLLFVHFMSNEQQHRPSLLLKMSDTSANNNLVKYVSVQLLSADSILLMCSSGPGGRPAVSSGDVRERTRGQAVPQPERGHHLVLGEGAD